MLIGEKLNLAKIAYFFVEEGDYHPPAEFCHAPNPKTNISMKVYERAAELRHENRDFFKVLGRFRDASYGPHIEILARNATLIRSVDQHPEMTGVKIYAQFLSIAGFDMDSIKETAEKLELPLENLVEN